jgi:hypothetical protein
MLLAGLAALGLWAGGAAAQEIIQPAGAPGAAEEGCAGCERGVAKGRGDLGYPTTGHVWHRHINSSAPHGPTNVGPRQNTPTAYPPIEVYKPNRPFLNMFCSHGVGCWSHHDRPTCSSLRSELAFIFGSCRTFFGEPCMQGPPTIPVPTKGPYR